MTLLKSYLLAVTTVVLILAGHDHVSAADTVTTTLSPSRAGNAIRTGHTRTVEYAQDWLQRSRYLRTQNVGSRKAHTLRRHTVYRGTSLYYIGSGLYTLRPDPRYDFSCRFLADCPCRYLAGC